MSDLSKPIYIDDEEFPTKLTVEFTEDGWTTTYTGSCINSTFDSYLVESSVYGRFWIPKCYVRLKNINND